MASSSELLHGQAQPSPVFRAWWKSLDVPPFREQHHPELGFTWYLTSITPRSSSIMSSTSSGLLSYFLSNSLQIHPKTDCLHLLCVQIFLILFRISF